MQKWEYALAIYDKEKRTLEANTMSGVKHQSGAHLDNVLEAIGQEGWEMCGFLTPLPGGYVLEDENSLAVIFKRPKS